MSTAVPHPRKRSPFVTATCFAVSGIALAALAYVEGVPARADVLLRPDVSPAVDSMPAPLRAPRGNGKQPRRGAAGALASAQPAAAATAQQTLPAPADGGVVVPDFVGKRLSVARRHARKLGLRVAARDEYGELVPADAARFYRVKRQLTQARSSLEPGSMIQFRVREIEFVGGY